MEDGGQAGEWGKRGLKREEGKERKRRAGRTNKSLGPVLPKDAADAMAAHLRARGRGHEGAIAEANSLACLQTHPAAPRQPLLQRLIARV